MNWIHSFLDRSLVPTWQYERAVRVLLELVLLVACAVPVVTGAHSAIAQLLVVALRLHQAETSREIASIISRAKERGLMLEPSTMGREKAKRLHALDQQQSLIAWTWPVLVPIVTAAETRAFGYTIAIGFFATWLRVWFDRIAMPLWRKSRVEWRWNQKKETIATVAQRVAKEQKEDWTW